MAKRLEIKDFGNRGIVLSMQRKQVSHDAAKIVEGMILYFFEKNKRKKIGNKFYFNCKKPHDTELILFNM